MPFKKFEYKMHEKEFMQVSFQTTKLDDYLNELGTEGWEVFMIGMQPRQGAIIAGGEPAIYLVFNVNCKREILPETK